MWGAGNNQAGLRVTSQRLLKNSSQLTLAIRNMSRFAICQSIDNLTQSSQTGIDLFGLVKYLALRTSLRYLLTACQIDQIEFASFGTQIGCVVLTDRQNEDHVRTRRTLVHVSSRNGPRIPCDFDELIHLIGRTDVFLRNIFNENPTFLIRPYLKIILIGVKQIT